MITQKYLIDTYTYSNGNLFTRKDNRKIGCYDIYGGYYKVSIKKKTYRLHRLIYLYHHGVLPKMVDHVNGNKVDNRIENLQYADDSINSLKKISKIRYSPVEPDKIMKRFVSYKKDHEKYYVEYMVDGKKVTVGGYKSLEKANIKAEEVMNKRISRYERLNVNIKVPDNICPDYNKLWESYEKDSEL